MPILLAKRLDCKGGLMLMRAIVLSTLCGGSAGLVMAVLENAL